MRRELNAVGEKLGEGRQTISAVIVCPNIMFCVIFLLACSVAFHLSSSTEQMGRVLQRTSISTNIKERLDFSCAVFGPDGGLVSNAPHIPVHLGAMQETVQYQVPLVGWGRGAGL